MSQTKTQLVEGLNINTSAPADALAIDNSGRLLIGTSSSSASAAVVIQGNSADATGACQLYLQCDQTNPVTNSDLGYIRFADGNGSIFAHVQGQVDATSGSGDYPGRLIFSTTADSASSPTERMRIDSSGRVGIGTTGPTFADGSGLEVQAAGTTTVRVDNSSAGSAGEFRADAVGTTIDCRGLEKFRVLTGGAERIRVDGNGLSIGIATQRSDFFNSTSVRPTFQIEGAGTDNRIASIVSNNTASGAGAVLVLGHEKSGATGGDTAVANGDLIGRLSFQGNDGSTFVEAAVIESYCDNAVGTDDMPGRLVFSTTPDGSTSPTERMRISSTGAVTIGATGSPGSLTVVGDVNNNELAIFNNLRTIGGYAEIDFRTAGTERGNIRWETGNVSYNTSSDYRLKENIRVLTGGIELVKQLRPCLFNFIEAGPEDTLGGFIAHEVQEVVDYAVSGQKDEVRKDGSIKPQCIDQSKLVPLLTAALQEALAEIESLKARVTALEP